jgi:hypothetical protein
MQYSGRCRREAVGDGTAQRRPAADVHAAARTSDAEAEKVEWRSMPQTFRVIFFCSIAAAVMIGTLMLGLTRHTLAVAAAVAAGPSYALVLYVCDRPHELRRQRLDKGQCLHCGYDLRDNVSGVCPECGAAKV